MDKSEFVKWFESHQEITIDPKSELFDYCAQCPIAQFLSEKYNKHAEVGALHWRIFENGVVIRKSTLPEWARIFIQTFDQKNMYRFGEFIETSAYKDWKNERTSEIH